MGMGMGMVRDTRFQWYEGRGSAAGYTSPFIVVVQFNTALN